MYMYKNFMDNNVTAVAIFLLLYGQFSIGFVEVKVVIIFVGVNL